MTRNGGVLEPVLATDPQVSELDELQFTLGEGPSRDASTSGAPVLQPDLSGLDSGRHWPVFAPAAAARGVRGIFAFPVGAGAARLGVLSVYRRQTGSLQLDEIQDSLAFADAMFVLALDHRHGLSTDLNEVIDAAFTARRAEVHQATGLIAAQQDIDVADALARLRAHAYTTGQPLHLLAADVMAGRIRLESDQEPGGTDRQVIPPRTDPEGSGPGAGSPLAETEEEW